MNQWLFYILSGILAGLFLWLIFLQVSFSKLKKRQKALFQGKKAQDLETIILKQKEEIGQLQKQSKLLYQSTKENRHLAEHGLYKTGLVRFNPFNDLGGDQSFSLALLDGEKNGLTISSLYSRDGVRVYAKSIKAGENSKHKLTKEESQAIAMASLEKPSQS